MEFEKQKINHFQELLLFIYSRIYILYCAWFNWTIVITIIFKFYIKRNKMTLTVSHYFFWGYCSLIYRAVLWFVNALPLSLQTNLSFLTRKLYLHHIFDPEWQIALHLFCLFASNECFMQISWYKSGKTHSNLSWERLFDKLELFALKIASLSLRSRSPINIAQIGTLRGWGRH